MTWTARAPANLALIKYMGKADSATNLPANPSLSHVLSRFESVVQLEEAERDHWAPLDSLLLSDVEQQRFLNHLSRIKSHFGYQGHFFVRSGNNFPAQCGLASSASSFAALTRCAVQAMCELSHQPVLSAPEMATLSRQGSGSSCRSFMSPWVMWEGQDVSSLNLPCGELQHLVAIVDPTQKKVSSSDAHQRVKTSLLYQGRAERAVLRLEQLLNALHNDDWSVAFQIVWQEFWDMHALFETSHPSFGYMTAQSMAVLKLVRNYWEAHGDGPLVTMDAGPNVHVLFRNDQVSVKEALAQHVKVL